MYKLRNGKEQNWGEQAGINLHREGTQRKPTGTKPFEAQGGN